MEISETEKFYLLLVLADSMAAPEQVFRLTKKTRENLWVEICMRNDEIKRIDNPTFPNPEIGKQMRINEDRVIQEITEEE